MLITRFNINTTPCPGTINDNKTGTIDQLGNLIYCIGRTDREQIRSRINNNDCRTFRPQRPLSTAYRTKETAV